MILCFHPHACEDYLYWQRTDPRKIARINELIRACTRDPFRGPGKPEPLRANWTGFWSRRIDRKHRLVYAVEGDRLLIAQCRYHYK